jgi:hypothetical protein
MRPTIRLLVVWFLLLWLAVGPVAPIWAANSWQQTDWSGGSGQATWSDASRFFTSSQVTHSVSGEVSLALGAPADWYDSAWQYRKALIVDADQVPGAAALTNFRLLVSLATDTELAASAQDDAADIVFTGVDGITQLDYEIESFNGTTGSLQAWVEIPSLSATTDTQLYLYYGNPDGGLTANHNPESVWGDYNLVYHLAETSGQHLDSTSNNNDTTTATVVSQGSATGKINGADQTNNSSQIVTPDNANGSLDLTTDFTISTWLYTLGTGIQYQLLLTKSIDGDSEVNYAIYLNYDNVFIAWYNGGHQAFATNTSPISANTWHLLTYRRSGQTEEIYVDGAVVASRTNVDPQLDFVTNNQNLLIAKQPSGFYFEGRLDEFRLSDSAFTPDYIATEYANQNDPATFYSLAAPEEYAAVYAGSGTLTSSIFDTNQASIWDTATFQNTTPTNTTAGLKIRSGSVSDLSDADLFTSCSNIVSGEDISSNSCVSDGDRYLQYQIELQTTDDTATPLFSDVIVNYSAIPVPVTTTENNSPSVATTPVVAPSCSQNTPVGIPDLFQIDRKPTSATLFFTPVNDHVRSYHVMFGYSSYDQRFGVLSQPSETASEGVQTITINHLEPKASYWFTVAPVNGCAVGSWSNWQPVKPQAFGMSIFYSYFPSLRRG